MIEELLKQDSYILSKYKKWNYIERQAYSNFDTSSRILGIIWLRWVGKTTYLLSRRIQSNNSFYISCDSMSIKNADLFHIIDELQKNYWYDTFYLDEIHFNKNWQQALKNIYDFLDVNIIFSGSNMINLTKWWYDLSRRALKYELKDFSFSEYVSLTKGINLPNYSLDDILNNHIQISKDNATWFSQKMFQNYLKFWQFGYFYEEYWDNEVEYKLKMENSIKKSIYEDLSDFVDIKTMNLSKLEDIIYYIANAWTSDISIHSISKKISLSPQVTEIYLNFLDSIWLVNILTYFGKLSDRIRKTKKFYLANTNILSLFESNIWNFRETFFVSCMKRLEKDIYFKSKTDFVLSTDEQNIYFEIWWKNKKKNQYSKNTFVVKDDILISEDKQTIPLWLFGLIN